MSSRHLVLDDPQSSSGSTQTFPSFQPGWGGGMRRLERLETESVCLSASCIPLSPSPPLSVHPSISTQRFSGPVMAFLGWRVGLEPARW